LFHKYQHRDWTLVNKKAKYAGSYNFQDLIGGLLEYLKFYFFSILFIDDGIIISFYVYKI